MPMGAYDSEVARIYHVIMVGQVIKGKRQKDNEYEDRLGYIGSSTSAWTI